MKIAAVVLMGALAAGATGARGQEAEQRYFPDQSAYTEARLVKLEKAMERCFDCDNEGVVESALAQIAWAKLNVPDRDFSRVRASLNQQALYGRSPQIRFDAYLVTLIIDHPVLFRGLAEVNYESGQDLFRAVSAQLQKTLMGYNDRKWVREE